MGFGLSGLFVGRCRRSNKILFAPVLFLRSSNGLNDDEEAHVIAVLSNIQGCRICT